MSLACVGSGCRGDLDDEFGGDSVGSTEGDGAGDTASEDTSEGVDDDGDTGSGSGTTGNGDGDGDGDGDGEGWPPTVGPGESCNPILAAAGVSVCDDPNTTGEMTCSFVRYMPSPTEYEWDFVCQNLADTGSNGADLGDPCNNATPEKECLNSFCLWNGLDLDPANSDHINFPDGVCPFETGDPGDPLTQACCAPYCDDSTPCDPGYYCKSINELGIGVEDTTGLGACVWNG